MGNYADNPLWADIEPLPQEESTSNALAVIGYAEEYSEATGYLRAVMAAGDMSERVLGLTEDIIMMNPAHYTVWIYRARTLKALSADLNAELAWLNPVALTHLKNYQIWHHRQTIVSQLGALPASELAFLDSMFAKDTKNYHVWSYRQWLIGRFALWAPVTTTTAGPPNGELAFIEALLDDDVRNNSAWNHRWFVIFGRPATDGGPRAQDSRAIVEREAAFAKDKIRLAPQNESPWTYLRGLRSGAPAVLPLSGLRGFAAEFAGVGGEGRVRSSHALDVLAEIYAAEGNMREEACKALDLLAEKYDPVRAKYWQYRKVLVNAGEGVGVST